MNALSFDWLLCCCCAAAVLPCFRALELTKRFRETQQAAQMRRVTSLSQNHIVLDGSKQASKQASTRPRTASQSSASSASWTAQNQGTAHTASTAYTTQVHNPATALRAPRCDHCELIRNNWADFSLVEITLVVPLPTCHLFVTITTWECI